MVQESVPGCECHCLLSCLSVYCNAQSTRSVLALQQRKEMIRIKYVDKSEIQAQEICAVC
jgi:hypothetical protein